LLVLFGRADAAPAGGGVDVSIQGAVDEARSWTWDEFTALPTEDVTVEVHCVRKWSKLDTRWKDVSARSGSAGRAHAPGRARLPPPRQHDQGASRRTRRRGAHTHDNRESNPCRRLLLGHAGPDPQARRR